MKEVSARGGLDMWIAKLVRLPRRPIVAGALSGVVSGLVLGAFTGPVGAVFGMWMGVAMGLVAGYVLAREDETQSKRTKELDSIIGITEGSMGAGPITMPPPSEEDEEAPAYSSKEAWLSEWLTPPPPVAR